MVGRPAAGSIREIARTNAGVRYSLCLDNGIPVAMPRLLLRALVAWFAAAPAQGRQLQEAGRATTLPEAERLHAHGAAMQEQGRAVEAAHSMRQALQLDPGS